MNSEITILRIQQVCQRTGLSKSHIYRLEKLRQFPARVALTAGVSGWLKSEVDAWLQNKVGSNRGTTAADVQPTGISDPSRTSP